MSVELRLQPGTFIQDALSTELPLQLVLISWLDLEAQMELFSDSKNFFYPDNFSWSNYFLILEDQQPRTMFQTRKKIYEELNKSLS